MAISVYAISRFIPTHVGNSWRRRLLSTSCAVHPHARGEQAPSNGSLIRVFGSSPRTWGTVDGGQPLASLDRFIPTHVGNSWPSWPSCPVLAGSSPRTWGTAHVAGLTLALGRFIPTHVGNSGLSCPVLPVLAGSSPRTWGTVGGCWKNQGSGRFIPTHVGNRDESVQRPAIDAVHPHARGEQTSPHCANQYSVGSSPRTWGTAG